MARYFSLKEIKIDCYIGNGYGTCWDAEGIYKELIEGFNQEQIIIAVFTIMDEQISNMLQLKSCSKQYLEMISIIKDKNTSPTVGEIIEMIYNIYSKVFF